MSEFFKNIFLILCCSISFISCAQKPIAVWDEKTDIFTSPCYNLRWDLSDMGIWNVAEEYRLPKNMIFCAGLADSPVVVGLAVADANREDQESIVNNSKSFIEGLVDKTISLNNMFPGIHMGNVFHEKCKFMFKNAIRFGLRLQVEDARWGIDEPITFIYGGYVFIYDNKLIIPVLLIPNNIVEEYGDEIINMFFERFSYINASNELVN